MAKGFDKIIQRIQTRKDIDRLVELVARRVDTPDKPVRSERRRRRPGSPKAIRKQRRKAARKARRRNRTPK
jgi:hypothetical protein